MKSVDFNPIRDVEKFHKTFKAPVLETPTIPAEDRSNLRVKLIDEEFDELKEAILKKDIVEIADALGDIQYVLSGAVLEFGLGDLFPAIFAEIHRSNMSKACHSEQEAEKTQKHYWDTKKVESRKEFDPKTGKWYVYDANTDKLLKSVNYSPADLKSIIYGKEV